MAKIDQIKETLSTFRMFFTIVSVMFIAIGGGLINMYKENQLNKLFFGGVFIEFLIFIVILMIGLIIFKRIKEIENNK